MKPATNRKNKYYKSAYLVKFKDLPGWTAEKCLTSTGWYDIFQKKGKEKSRVATFDYITGMMMTFSESIGFSFDINGRTHKNLHKAMQWLYLKSLAPKK